jgi:hypothetical protein
MSGDSDTRQAVITSSSRCLHRSFGGSLLGGSQMASHSASSSTASGAALCGAISAVLVVVRMVLDPAHRLGVAEPRRTT